jgi:hypothetical protein
MATYLTEIQYGGPNAPWNADADLEITITNRKGVVPADSAPSTGTQVSWASSAGNGSVTFYDNGSTFSGSAQFPNEGPVGYRGSLK